MGTHVDELLAKLIAAGVPAPAVETMLREGRQIDPALFAGVSGR